MKDIGFIGNSGSTEINISVEPRNKSQVYLATHDINGNKLSLTQRSHISFSWGGKDIEDFDFLVVSDGGTYQRGLYSSFEETTTENSVMDGRHYWGFRYRANEIVFSLSTDGVLESTLQQLRTWFKPGIERELILSEFPFRAIKAKIAETPNYSLTPFEEIITRTINNKLYKTSTTKWRGSLAIHFIMDDPHWYSTSGVFQNVFTGEDTINLEGETVEVNERYYEDQLKAVIEDGVPYISMFKTDCLLPNGLELKYDSNNDEATIQQQENITLVADAPQYLYYCGTAPEKPIISFSFDLDQFDENNYFNGIGNKYSGSEYSKISFGNRDFIFTTPSFLTAYNQIVSILLNDFEAGDSLYELKVAIRDTVSNFYIRAWALGICELALQDDNELGICDVETTSLTENYSENFIICLKKIFSEEENEGNCYFDFNKDLSLFSLNTNVLDLSLLDEESVISPNNLPVRKEQIEEESNGELISVERPVPVFIEENSGDMIRSRHLILEERKIYNGNNEITTNECIEIVSNCTLNNFKINYQYRYL